MQNEKMNDEAVSPVIATILMVAITVVLAGVLFVWASSLAEGNTDGNLALYQFSAEDANGDTTDQNDDNLVRVTMSQGGDLNWASISVKISVDNAALRVVVRHGGELWCGRGVRCRKGYLHVCLVPQRRLA